MRLSFEANGVTISYSFLYVNCLCGLVGGIVMKQICASFEDYIYKEIVKTKNELAITQISKAVNYIVTAYLQELEPLQRENAQLKEDLGFLRSEFDRIHREIQEPLKLLTASTEKRNEVTPTQQSRSLLDKILRRNKATT